MRLLETGDYAYGLEQAAVNDTAVPGFKQSGATCFLNEYAAIFQATHDDPSHPNAHYELYQVTRAGEWQDIQSFDEAGESVLRAGGNTWIATLALRTGPESRGYWRGDPLPPKYSNHAVLDVNLDGSAIMVDPSGTVFSILWASGSIDSFQASHVDGGSVRLANGAPIVVFCQFPGPRLTLWTSLGMAQPGVWGTGQYFPMVVSSQASDDWLMYFADDYGLVIHPVLDKRTGYQFAGKAFYGVDLALVGAGARIVSSLNAAESMDAIQVRDIFEMGAGMVPIEATTPTPIPPEPIPPDPTPIPPDPIPPEPTPVPPQPTPEPPMPTGKYTVIYPGEHLFNGQTPLGTQVVAEPHPQGGGALALKRADGQYATVATFNANNLDFKAVNPPGGGEAFYDAGNQYINVDGNGQPHAFLKSGSYGQ